MMISLTKVANEQVALKLVPQREIFISLLMGEGQDYDALKEDIMNLVTMLQPLLDETYALLVRMGDFLFLHYFFSLFWFLFVTLYNLVEFLLCISATVTEDLSVGQVEVHIKVFPSKRSLPEG